MSIDKILDAVLAEGLATFSMPSLGDRLGVAYSGLYRYVSDRDDLLVLALGRVAREACWPSHDLPWREQLAGIGETLWTICGTYPGYDAAAVSTRNISPGFVEMLTPYVDSMCGQGLDIVDATAAIDFVRTLVLNSSIDATRLDSIASMPDAPEHSIPAYADPEKWEGRSWYRRQLETYLDGLAHRVGPT